MKMKIEFQEMARIFELAAKLDKKTDFRWDLTDSDSLYTICLKASHELLDQIKEEGKYDDDAEELAMLSYPIAYDYLSEDEVPEMIREGAFNAETAESISTKTLQSYKEAYAMFANVSTSTKYEHYKHALSIIDRELEKRGNVHYL